MSYEQIVQGLTLFSLSAFLFALSFYVIKLKNRLIRQEELLKDVVAKEQKVSQELSEYKKKFNQEVLRDTVTGLPCFSAFKEQAQVILEQNSRHKTLFGFLFLDLRNFKMINNTLGYTVGDLVLKEASERIQLSIRHIDSVSRFSGDVFVVLLAQLSHPESAVLIVRRLFQKLGEPFNIEHHELFVSSNMGISIYPMDGEDISSLLRNAAQALTQAKTMGSLQYQYYRADMHSHSQRELALNSALCRDLFFQELVMEYQPQWNVETHEILGWEALLRWHHPELGLISPREFIRLAENNGRIESIGEWTLFHVCHQLQHWQSQGYVVPTVSINISLRQLESQHFVTTILHALQETKIDPKCLVLEVAENEILRESKALEKTLTILNRLGINVAVDHFEGGDLLLRYLKYFPMQYLKIDSSFIRELGASKESETIISTMTQLAKNLNKRIIALGVETETQKQILLRMGCSFMQGYLFSPPLNEREVVNQLQPVNLKPVHEKDLTVS